MVEASIFQTKFISKKLFSNRDYLPDYERIMLTDLSHTTMDVRQSVVETVSKKSNFAQLENQSTKYNQIWYVHVFRGNKYVHNVSTRLPLL